MKRTAYLISLPFILWPLITSGDQQIAKTKGNETSNPSAVTVETQPFRFKSSTLGGRVNEAMLHGKEGYSRPIELLMEMHKDNPGEVLRLLKPHRDNPDIDVQITIIEAASCAPHDPQAVMILTALAPNYDIGHLAIRVFYENYTRQQIVKEGGEQLKRALFRAVFSSRYATNGYLLLSCFKADPRTISFLQKRRKSFEQVKKITGKPKPKDDDSAPPDRTNEIIALDLALVELGQADALQRVNQIFVEKNNDRLQALLRYLKFVESKTVLLQAVELLNDKSVALSIRNPDGKVIRSIRICDVAFIALSRRAGTLDKKVDLIDEFSLPNFSDQELTQAYEKLKTIFEKVDAPAVKS